MTRFASFLVTPIPIALLLCITLGSLAMGQSPEPPDSPATEPASTSLTVVPGGIGRHVAGRWATMAVNGANRSNVDVEETAVVIIGDNKTQQYARRVWIPAGARRTSWLPALIPDELYPDQLQLSMTSIQLRQSGDVEQYRSNVVGMPTSQRSLMLSWEPSRTAIVLAPNSRDGTDDELSTQLVKTVYAARDSAVPPLQDLGLIHLTGGFLPPVAKSLDAVDQMVIASDWILGDTVTVARLRTWLNSGGRIWIMVDQVSPDAVRALLGDAACYSVVDRVELNEFEIEQAAEFAAVDEVSYEQWSSEVPVELVRAFVDTDDVQSRIDGWPIAFWKKVGAGEVLFTTLGARGWVHGDEPTRSIHTAASRFFLNRIEPPRQTAEMISFLDDEIGYRIPTRGSVATVLGLHLVLVVATGAWLAWRRKLQYLAFAIPLAALVATTSLVTIGNRQTFAVPSTIATGQIARVIPETSEVQVDTVAAIYSQQGRPLSIESTPETTTTLLDGNPGGAMTRVAWNDSGKSSWQFVTQPPGVVRHVESDSIVEVAQPWSVTGRFTKLGFEGRLSGLDPTQCEDAVIVTASTPPLAVNINGATPGAFSAGPDSVMSADQFIDAKLMSDVQQDRQRLLRQLVSPETQFVGRDPSLMVWTRPVDSGISFDDGYARRGWALASIPIRFERSAGGTEFRVPATFVQLEAHVGTRGPSTIFNQQTGTWLSGMNRPNESELRCLLPKVLMPCQLKRAIVQIKINAPSRTLEVKGFVEDQFKTLHRVENPTGLLRFEIDQTEALQLDAEGGLVLSIAISETEDERMAAVQAAESDDRETPSRSTWSIDHVHVYLEGTTL